MGRIETPQNAALTPTSAAGDARVIVHQAAAMIDAIAAEWTALAATASEPNAFAEHWFHAKLLLVILLTGYQGWMSAYGRRLASGKRPLENRTLRIMNEVPGIAAAVIVVLVVVRPF